MEPAGPTPQGTHDTPPTFEEFCGTLHNEYEREQGRGERKIEFDVADSEHLRSVFGMYYLINEEIRKVRVGECNLDTFLTAVAPLGKERNRYDEKLAKKLLTPKEQTIHGFYQYLLNKVHAAAAERDLYDFLKKKERKALERDVSALHVDPIDISLEGIPDHFLYTPVEHRLIGSTQVTGVGFHPNAPLGLFSAYLTRELEKPKNAKLGLENLTLEGINALRQGKTIKMNYLNHEGEEFLITLTLLPISADDSVKENARMTFTIGDAYSVGHSEVLTPSPFNVVEAVAETIEQLQQSARRR